MALLQFYVKYTRLIEEQQSEHDITKDEETVLWSGRRGRSVVESDWSGAFFYDYSAESNSDGEDIVSLVSDALCCSTDITTELVDEMCPNLCCQIRELVRQWAAVAGEVCGQIRIVTVVDVVEEVLDGGIRFDYGAQITRYADCLEAADAPVKDGLCSFPCSSSQDDD